MKQLEPDDVVAPEHADEPPLAVEDGHRLHPGLLHEEEGVAVRHAGAHGHHARAT